MTTITIAGASGFVGKALIRYLSKQANMHIRALSRKDYSQFNTNCLTWVKSDLFSLLDTEKALNDTDIAIYLVHSMLPSAKLVQGGFEDFDIILADNFARSAKKNNVKQIIYLSGIIPEEKNLSGHLFSRLEVENTLMSSGVPVTSLRSGLIIGALGSSFQIMYKLVQKLPFMLCPSWTRTLSSPIDLQDVLKSILYCINNPNCLNKIYDIGGPDILSYKEMMQIVAKHLNRKISILTLPLFSPTLSRLWVSTITRAPKNLVYPLIKSLRHSMLPSPSHQLIIPNHTLTHFETSVQKAIQELYQSDQMPHAYHYSGSENINEVRSIQRLHTYFRSNANEVSNEYFKWLPLIFCNLIGIKKEQSSINLFFLTPKICLLRLIFAPSRSDNDRQLYYIKGGILSHSIGRGRLEFRSIYDRKYTIAAIHEFRPRLPWYIYRYTQALAHQFIMKLFNTHLINKRF